MKILLLQDVKKIGKKGEIKDVSDGYARNFILAKKLGEMATEAAVRKNEQQVVKNKQEQEKAKIAVQKMASLLDGKKIVIKSKAKDGKLFGSITAKNIAENLKKDGFEVSEKAIIFESMKNVGEKEAQIVFDFNIKAKISIKIEAQ
ncbi:MAG: hypothetical protein ACD_11C00020G0043 [uncultured bacterium]|nr:MAG: hypothetical protein ACD_11C00020G0043 [uncultured bacterium]HBR71328.1 50S ribosomal protein L9 [Candidatus Moranbacteria bacterium]